MTPNLSYSLFYDLTVEFGKTEAQEVLFKLANAIHVVVGLNTIMQKSNRWLHIYIYIYIYVCVCVTEFHALWGWYRYTRLTGRLAPC